MSHSGSSTAEWPLLPAPTTGFGVDSGSWLQLWAFWVAPIVGALLAGWVSRMLRTLLDVGQEADVIGESKSDKDWDWQVDLPRDPRTIGYLGTAS